MRFASPSSGDGFTAVRPPGVPAPARHVPELDAVRALAIGSVFCLHWLPRDTLLDRVQDQTTSGVHLFFVLSGYLITRTLLASRAAVNAGTATRRYALGQFFARRTLRIFPVFYLALFAGAALNFAGVRAGFWWHAGYLSNVYYYYRSGRYDGPATLFWSLAVEEQFYLVWPLVILFLPRRWVLPTVLAIMAASAGLRVRAQFDNRWAGMLTPWCALFLAGGSAVAVAGDRSIGSPAAHRALTRAFLVAAGGLALGSIGVWVAHGTGYALRSPGIRAMDQVAVTLAFACGLDAIARRGAVGGPAGRALRWGPVVYLGRISYGLYAYYLFVTDGLPAAWIPAGVAGRFAVRFAAAVAVASISWFLLERPLLRFKRLFPVVPAGTRPPATAISA